jgi:YVTN family beta-propeller protein
VWSLDVSPDGRTLYVGGYGAVTEVETAGHTVVAEIPVDLGEGGAALTPDGATLLVSRGGALSFLETARRQVVETIPIGTSNLGGIAVAPDGARAYVDGGGYGIGVTVVDLARHRVVGGVPFGYSPGDAFFEALAVSADGLSLFTVTTFRPYGPTPRLFHALSVIDTDRDAIVETLTPEVEPAAIAFSRGRGLGYVANAGANTISVLDPTARRIVDTIPVGSRPAAIAIAPAPGATPLATVTVRPTRTPTATPTLTPDLCPHAIVVQPDHGPPGARIGVSGTCDQLAGFRYAQLGLVPPVAGALFPQPRGDANGAYRGGFTIPRGARPGAYLVQVITGSVIGEAPFTIDPPCTGDCDGHGGVRIDELIIGVNLVLGVQPITRCPAFDVRLDGVVTVDALVAAVGHALEGCGDASPRDR